MNECPFDLAFYSFFHAPTGYGMAGRGYLHAFDRAGIPVSAVPIGQRRIGPVTDPVLAKSMGRRKLPRLHLWHSEPEDLRAVINFLPELIVLTTWEADRISELYAKVLNHAREVWVPCRYNEEAFRRQLTVPVRRIPHPVDELAPEDVNLSAFNRKMHLQDDDFVVVSVGTWQQRKNLEGSLEAFCKAFGDEPRAHFILKTSLTFMDFQMVQMQVLQVLERIPERYRYSLFQRIHLHTELWGREQMAALRARTDCYLTLHRGEGWCYPAFEAACMGKPVVSTGYSGPLDFLDARHHHLVGYKLIPADQSKQKLRFGFTSNMQWADPDVDEAARALRRVFEHYGQCRALAGEAAAEIRTKFSLEAVGRQAREYLEAIDAPAEGRQETYDALCAC